MRFRNSSAQRLRGLGFKTSFVNHHLGAAHSLGMTHSLWASCQLGYNQKRAAKIAKPVLKPEPGGPLQSRMPQLMGLQCHPKAARWISGPWPECLQGTVSDGRVWSLCYSRNHCSSASVKRHRVPPQSLPLPKFCWGLWQRLCGTDYLTSKLGHNSLMSHEANSVIARLWLSQFLFEK